MSEHSILIVDDNEDIRTNIKDILDDMGYETDTAEDGPTALEKVRERSFDVALVDFKMPGMDGAELYREIRRLRPEIVAIMITAYAGSNGAQEALDAGTWKVLRKPVDFPELLSMIDQVVHEPVVLVVDDDNEFCDNLWQLLRDRGYRVSIAHSEEEGLEKAASAKIDVAIIDVKLGTADCREVYRRLCESHPQAKTVMITGYRSEADSIIAELAENGPDGICYKPIAIPELMDTLDQFCSG